MEKPRKQPIGQRCKWAAMQVGSYLRAVRHAIECDMLRLPSVRPSAAMLCAHSALVRVRSVVYGSVAAVRAAVLQCLRDASGRGRKAIYGFIKGQSAEVSGAEGKMSREEEGSW